MREELLIPETPSMLPALEAGSSLVGWFLAYCRAEVMGAPKTTVDAKRRDLQLFLVHGNDSRENGPFSSRSLHNEPLARTGCGIGGMGRGRRGPAIESQRDFRNRDRPGPPSDRGEGPGPAIIHWRASLNTKTSPSMGSKFFGRSPSPWGATAMTNLSPSRLRSP